MTKELLRSLLETRHLDLFVLGVATLITIGLSFFMGMVILKKKANVWRSCVLIVLVFLYFFITKWFAPHWITPFIHLFLLGSALAYNCKANILFSLGAAFLSIMATSTGDFLMMLLTKFIESTAPFLTKTSWGIIITQIAGWIIPLIVINLVCRKRKESIFDDLNIKEAGYSLLIYGAWFYQIYHAIVDYFSDVLKPDQFANMIIYGMIFVGGYLAMRAEWRKRHAAEIKAKEDEINALKKNKIFPLINIKKLVLDYLQEIYREHHTECSIVGKLMDKIEKEM